jgi:hypothetical protein
MTTRLREEWGLSFIVATPALSAGGMMKGSATSRLLEMIRALFAAREGMDAALGMCDRGSCCRDSLLVAAPSGVRELGPRGRRSRSMRGARRGGGGIALREVVAGSSSPCVRQGWKRVRTTRHKSGVKSRAAEGRRPQGESAGRSHAAQAGRRPTHPSKSPPPSHPSALFAGLLRLLLAVVLRL